MVAAVIAAALVVAGASLLVGDFVCADARGWLAWGDQLLRLDGSFSTELYPSWKPLPVLLTVPLSLTGGAAPLLWLALDRAAGILALVLALRVGWRLAGPRAGLAAAFALAVTPMWWATFSNGRLEPLLAGLLLLAVDRHLSGRPAQALALGTLVALGREEALVVVAGYGMVMARADARLRLPLLAALVAVPVAWLGGDWLGSGSPFHGGELAKRAPDVLAQAAQGSMVLRGISRAVHLLPLPVWGTAAVAVAIAVRRREPRVPALAVGAAAWIAMDVTMAGFGYPVEARFLLPAGALLSVVGGVGVAFLAERVAEARARRQAAAWRRQPAVAGDPQTRMPSRLIS